MDIPYISTRRLDRRRMLKGLGVGLALPSLEQCVPVFGRDAAKAEQAPRMLLISNNLGVLPEPFFPKDSGAGYTLTPYLENLSEFRNDFTIFSGLSHPAVAGGHSTENCFLTGAKDPTGTGFRNSISLDQFAVENLPQTTRFPSLNLGVNIDKANRSLSWTRDGALLPAEDSPARLFRKLFLQGDAAAVNQRLHRLKQRGSILDAVHADLTRYQGSLNQSDRSRLDQYFTSVRELEKQLQVAAEWENKPRPAPDRAAPEDILDKAKFFQKFQLMLNMGQLALETDSTRIVTLMVDAYATPVFEINSDLRSMNGYHNLSHHGQVKEKIAQLEKVDHRQMRLLRDLLTSMSLKQELGSRFLDKVMVLYGSNMGDSNTHDNTNLPILLAGGGFQHGRHLQFDRQDNTPLSNLFLSLLHHMGIEVDQFSSSTKPLGELTSTV